jgi:hypothetical protein
MTCSCVVSHLFIHNSFFFQYPDSDKKDSMYVFIFHMLISAAFRTLFQKKKYKEKRDRYRKNIKTHQKNITFYTLFFRQKMKRKIIFYIANRNEIYDFLYLERWMRCTDVWMDIATVYTHLYTKKIWDLEKFILMSLRFWL